MKKKKILMESPFKSNVRRKVLTGLLVILPIYVTFIIIKFLLGLVGGILSPLVRKVFLFYGFALRNSSVDEFVVTSVAFVLVFIALYFIGVFATNFFGRLLIKYFEVILDKMPIIKNIYKSCKQMIELIGLPSRKAFKRVVLIDYPRVGMKVVAFVTGSMTNNEGTELTSIFIPTTPNPTSGFLIYLPEEEIIETNMTIEEGMKLIVSGGILVPDELDFHTKKPEAKADA
ncbi:MAG: DUF502 domain-containing protein [Candidatus Scalindua sp. AMX11]|nr:MAG: DUF502 domain-containing protein [Candidatus Scalindua sp.]NOG84164.1 DUF502 domain-containing protein [Planctomycetota bacterium]RZV98929.1 MAG: DUF502 domain-containing protein [Candidatus Scalindua sp. SCAELEC01]TDE66879.1 MAG: DUF502 domain-containing protein [Candidatus Scalindua sp. AMX11]GJQ57681.1 MAG: membrane protein [Candidatus Scalindua sp.]